MFIRFLLILFLSFSLYGNIDDEIDNIRNASNQDRFKLMNAFKKKIIKMKQKERIKAIKKLSSLSNKKKNKKILKEIEKTHQKSKNRANRIQGHIENEAEDHIEDMHDDD